MHTYNSFQSDTAFPARSTCTPVSCSCCTGCSASYIGPQLGVATGKGSKKKKVNMSVRHLEEFEKESSIITLYKSADISNEIQTDR